jgi:hypothetical protein
MLASQLKTISRRWKGRDQPDRVEIDNVHLIDEPEASQLHEEEISYRSE